MGKIISNGIEYGGSSINNEINGVFIDTDNVIANITINDGSIVTTAFTYTATTDCYFTFLCANASNLKLYINNNEVWRTSESSQQRYGFYVKQGQEVRGDGLDAYAYYTVYGIQQGSQDTTKNEIYYTEERAVGTWVDGSTIYQKTVNIGKITNTGEKVYTLGIENVDYLVDVRITPLLRANEANLYTLDNYNPSWSAGSYTSVAMNNDPADGLKITIYSGYYTSANDIYVTVQYTKSTT